MSDDLGQIRGRQDAFDVQLTTLEQSVESQSSLRASMHEEIANIGIMQRAQHRMLQAVGTTLSEHLEKLTSIDGRLGSVDGRLGNVDSRLNEHTIELFSIR